MKHSLLVLAAISLLSLAAPSAQAAQGQVIAAVRCPCAASMIVKIGNQPVTDVAQLLAQVAALKPGTATRFAVERRNQALELDVTPGVRPRPRSGER